MNKLWLSVEELKRLAKKEEKKNKLKERKNKDGEYEQVNYFDRKKTEKPKIRELKFLQKERKAIYFDTETFLQYSNKEDKKEVPIIIPYAIGVCTEEPGSYRDFIGVLSVYEFFEYLRNLEDSSYGTLCAFNIDYDFHAIRPFIFEKYKSDIDMHYEMTDESKKFIYGEIKTKKRSKKGETNSINLRFCDLWRWDTNQSLDSYIQNILKITYDSNGNVKDDKLSKQLDEIIKLWGFTKDSFKKGSIDYVKINLHKIGDKWYYYPSKEDWINDTNLIELDLSETSNERSYLKIDVTSLPVIHKEQKLMKELAKEVLEISNPYDTDFSITAPGFVKWLCEEKLEKYLTEIFKVPVTEKEYITMLYSYFGAFVAGNSKIPYLDEEVFKKLYPKESFYNADGTTKIKSYDVNSMYPWVMHLGLPMGEILHARPQGKPFFVDLDGNTGGDYVEWYEIQFKSYVQDKEVYRWKKKYSFFNNSFFGEKYTFGLVPNLAANNKGYVLKQIYDLFKSMCFCETEIVAVRYQLINRDLNDFIEKLYTIKRNDEKEDGTKPYSDSTVALIKLMLNSLYGKMAEKFKLEKVQWASNLPYFLSQNLYLFDRLDELGVEIIDEAIIKKKKFENNIAPHISLEHKAGFFKVETREKRFDRFGEECRESITAGMFITSIARWKLLSTIKQEVDQGNVVLYCDTDSIKLIQLKDPVFVTHDKDLGAWKDEGDFYYFGHPDVPKKYFMFNPNRPIGHKKRWMVKTSGFPARCIRKPNGDFDLDVVRTCYYPKNKILLKNARPSNKRNKYYQRVIGKSDFLMQPEDEIFENSYVIDNGVLTKDE